MSRLATFALLGALVATPAFAQKAKGVKYTRNPDVKVDETVVPQSIDLPLPDLGPTVLTPL